MGFTWELHEKDREIVARELESFLPKKIYDIHAHLYRLSFWDTPPAEWAAGPADITMEVYKEQMQWLFPNRELHGILFSLAFVPDTGPGNAWVGQEIRKDPLSRGHFLVRPTDDPEWVRQEVKRLGLRGLKPFNIYSRVVNSWEAEIPDFLPEPLMVVANEEGWTITLHIVRSTGIADQSNQFWIRRYCQRYPNANILLDHAARGFNPYHTIEGLPKLTGLNNLWIDPCAVCHPLAIEAALKIMGPRRVLYGSDYCISHFRATNFPVGDTFMWLYEDAPVWHLPVFKPVGTPPLIGIENLRAIKAAFWAAGLSDTEVENFFWGNAASLLGLK